jgi:hypothetical protein
MSFGRRDNAYEAAGQLGIGGRDAELDTIGQIDLDRAWFWRVVPHDPHGDWQKV